MPLRSDYRLQREGFTSDTLARLFTSTLFNPLLTLPLALLARYTYKGQTLSLEHAKALKWLKVALAIGLYKKVEKVLDWGVLNNWVGDRYVWEEELVVVTGGSDGIGRIVVGLLAERGIRVAVMDIQPLTFEAPPNVTYFHTDLASPTSIAAATSAIKSQLGNPTILINNAGIHSGSHPITTTPPHLLDLNYRINVLSHFHTLSAFLPSMIAANHGMVLTVASLAAHASAPLMAAYAGSKAAAMATHEVLHAELATVHKAPKVRTVLVCPAFMRTKLFQGFDEGDGWVMYALEPETVAEGIVKAVLRGRSDVLVMPGAGWALAVKLRGMPSWWGYGLRKGFVKLMSRFVGRAVVQGEGKVEEGGESERKGPEESMVVVQNEQAA
ncbi:NAD(P)-binding protein [Aulographum hederae CBS 113979]|uniref:NAD(P)-binding protein n=1 Tax=Aulographum hederae CBS 113979 TaxID=1176131 RepID=A0A6G1GRC4_9PEZI|nr:NAD(P)-binding protein [Aulographum hederae CBS 113979]